MNKLIKSPTTGKEGYISITEENDDSGMLMDFGLLKLQSGKKYSCSLNKERAFLLMDGCIRFNSGVSESIKSERRSLLDENPYVLHVPAGVEIEIECLSDKAELCVQRKTNSAIFPQKLYSPEEVRSEIFGENVLDNTSRRIVRTVFDGGTNPDSAMVLGEVINFPGRWSSYPPHNHPQPEIYHYRFFPPQGFGVSIVGEQAQITHTGDTCTIPPGLIHSQTSAPGYAMYYIWMISHLPDARFYPDSRRFVEEHVKLSFLPLKKPVTNQAKTS